jgi:hypothetical protein
VAPDVVALFENWLKRQVTDVLSERHRRLFVEEDDEKEQDPIDDLFDDEEDGGDPAPADDKASPDESKPSDELPPERDPRGGPQQAAAAKREVPTPDADDLSLEDIIDKLNAVRSGRSLKDEGVRQRIGTYFQEMTSAQRLALFAFLEGLAEVIATEVPGDDARSPSDPDIGIGMERTQTERDVEERPTATRVVKQDAGSEQGSTSSRSNDARTQQVQQRGIKGGGPKITRDATDDVPIMVVKR